MIGDNLKEIMKSKGVKPSQVCKATGLKRPHLSQIRAGRSNPSVQVLKSLAEFLQCTTDELLGCDHMCGDRWLKTGKP
jgi:transcriptional regulator with XRE-family HTH domain